LPLNAVAMSHLLIFGTKYTPAITKSLSQHARLMASKISTRGLFAIKTKSTTRAREKGFMILKERKDIKPLHIKAFLNLLRVKMIGTRGLF